MKTGDLVWLKGYHRFWVVLLVTKKEFKTTDIDVSKPGLCAFGGLWYGSDPLKSKNYGKVLELHEFKPEEITVTKTIEGLSRKSLKRMVD